MKEVTVRSRFVRGVKRLQQMAEKDRRLKAVSIVMLISGIKQIRNAFEYLPTQSFRNSLTARVASKINLNFKDIEMKNIKEIAKTKPVGEVVKAGIGGGKVLKIAIISAVVLAVIVVGGIGVYLALKDKGKEDVEESTTEDTTSTTEAATTTSATVTTTSVEADPYAGWKTYTNPTYGYSFKYPASVTVTEYPIKQCVGDGGGCISVENPGDVVGVTINDEILYIRSDSDSDRSIYESHYRSPQDEEITEFTLDNVETYAIFYYNEFFEDMVLSSIVYNYRYEEYEETAGTFMHLYIKDTYRNGSYNFKIDLGYTPMRNLTVEEFEPFLKVFETFEF